jgi:type VI secretion system protein ImpB
MANDSFQNEVPPSRVNIRYVKDVGGAKEKVELPHRVLVMGKFSGREDDLELGEIEKVNIDGRNVDSVMEDMDIRMSAVVPDRLSDEKDAEMKVELAFNRMKDFRPESVTRQVPELDALIKIRGLLADLKARVINNRDFRKELELILKDKGLSEDLAADIQKIAAPSGEDSSD